MPRRPRLVLPHVPPHLIQRGNNRIACFYADEEDANCLDWLNEYADKTECQIHAYVRMTHHVHLLVSTQKAEAIGRMMKYAKPPTATMR
jgi:putative transposase